MSLNYLPASIEAYAFRERRMTPVALKCFKFNGGESHIKIETDLTDSDVIIVARLRDGDDFMSLALMADAVRRASGRPSAYIPYFPYARQDRQMVPGEPLSVKVAAELVNAMRFECVTVFDPHSDVTPALLDNCKVVDNSDFIRWVLNELRHEWDKSHEIRQTHGLLLVAPDAGAGKKIHSLANKLGYTRPIITASKIRNVATGEILKQTVDGHVAGHTCLIIDDICDGGRTFVGLAQVLKGHGAIRVYLAVSHGIFSHGYKLEGLDGIYSTDSFKSHLGEIKELPLSWTDAA